LRAKPIDPPLKGRDLSLNQATAQESQRRRRSPFAAFDAERRRVFNPPFRPVLLVWILMIAGLCALIAAVGSLDKKGWSAEAFFFWRQDLPVLALSTVVLVALGVARQAQLARLRLPARFSARNLVLTLAAVCFVASAVGVQLVFSGYVFSLDEFLANFDAQIFARGRLLAPVPPAWRDFQAALQPMYMLPLPPGLWASSYLPVNAALRALGRLAHAEGLVNPLLSAFSVVAVHGVARRLWPDRPELALIAAALLATSAQLIVTAMTAYAMPAHLAFNLGWLWLFLRGGRAGHAGAIAVGFLASGLHQLIFHPIFVAPFILRLWFRRQWGLAALYTVAYGLIGVFWIEYWPLVTHLAGAPADGGDSTGGDLWMDRITDTLNALSYQSPGVMAEGLVRFIAWQNPLTAPLAAIGAVTTIWTKGPLRALVFGVFLTLAAMAVASPTQTHGWGYRYLHGLLGSVCLVAAWGWSRLTEVLPEARRKAAAGALGLACAISLLVLTPIRAWQAWDYVRPFAAANAAIQSAKADVVVVDHDSQVLFDMGTLTRNDPFLEHSPKVMALIGLSGPLLRELCASRSVLIFDGRSAAEFGIPLRPQAINPGIARVRRYMAELGCGRRLERTPE
jgi:hypothetical protein